MARPKKEKVVAPKEESLAEVLSPTYTLEPKEDIVVEKYLSGDIRLGIIQFIRRLEGFDDVVRMQVKIDSNATKVTSSSYNVEDLQDSYALGCKVDTYLRVKQSTDKYSFGVDSAAIKKVDASISIDFHKFHEELVSLGYRCRMNFNINDVLISMQTNSVLAVTFEVIK